MFDLIPFSVFEGRIYEPRLQTNNFPHSKNSLSPFKNSFFENPTQNLSLDHFKNLNSEFDFQNESRISRKDDNSRAFSLSNVKPENLKISLNKKEKVLSISAEEVKEENRNGCQYSSSSSVSYKIQLPENVKFESLKSELDGDSGKLEVKWDVEKFDVEALKKRRLLSRLSYRVFNIKL